MRSFVKMKSSQNGEITLSITDIGKSCTNREFLAPQECLITLFAKIKFLRKVPDLQYLQLKRIQNMYNWYKMIYDVNYIPIQFKYCTSPVSLIFSKFKFTDMPVGQTSDSMTVLT